MTSLGEHKTMSLTKIILILIATGAAIFIFLLYITLKDKVNDVSDEEPYKELVGKSLSLSRDILLVKNYSPLAKFVPNFLEETTERLEDRTPLLYKLPKGTHMTIQKFKTVKNGTSGDTGWYAVGKVFVAELNADMDFEYVWPRSYSLLQNKYLEHGTPPWKECPFDSDIRTQSITELSKKFADVNWEPVQEKAIAKISPTETIKLSMGGCLRYNWTVSFETSDNVSLVDIDYWNKKVNWIFENVFTEERTRFQDAMLNKKIVYDSAFSNENKSVYVFTESQSDTKNNYPGIEISHQEKVKKLEISWYLVEGWR